MNVLKQPKKEVINEVVIENLKTESVNEKQENGDEQNGSGKHKISISENGNGDSSSAEAAHPNKKIRKVSKFYI